MALILIRAGGAIRTHHTGVGRGAVGDHFIARAAVGRPAGGGSVGINGTWRRFAGCRIRGTRLVFRGMVSATRKKHQANQRNNLFHDIESFRLVKNAVRVGVLHFHLFGNLPGSARLGARQYSTVATRVNALPLVPFCSIASVPVFNQTRRWCLRCQPGGFNFATQSDCAGDLPVGL
jgi:hypothetical protein